MKLHYLLLTTATIFYLAVFSATAQETAIFDNITEAMSDLIVDRDAVKKIIFTGEIEGDDYSQDSE